MEEVKGTVGYAQVISSFVEATQAIPFETLHQDFLKFIPTSSSLVLDIGAGIGRDAFEFSQKGHTVWAVEPLEEFRTVGNELYQSANLIWWNDALPELVQLTPYENQVDFILCSGVWHHLNEKEQEFSMKRVSQLLKPGGLFALSLRNGPAGSGTHVFPIDFVKTKKNAEGNGLEIVFNTDNQSSLMKNKEKVKWARLVLKMKDDFSNKK